MKQQWVYGLHAVQSLLKSAPQRAEQVWALQGRDDQRLQKILQQARSLGLSVQYKSRKELDAVCENGQHQGIALLAQPGVTHDEKFLWDLLEEIEQPPFLLVLDGVTDPHNLGACLRTADAAGVHAVVVPKDNSVGLTETVRKVACGAAETVPLVAVTNLARALQKVQQKGLWVVGTSGDASVPIFEAPLTGPLVLVLGSEGKGMRRLTREHCDHMTFIPMAGSVSSLNVSVAAGVCLFEAVRQRT